MKSKYEALDYFLDREEGDNITVTCDWLLYAEELKDLLVSKREVDLNIQELIKKYEQESGEHSNPENAWIIEFIYDLKSLKESNENDTR